MTNLFRTAAQFVDDMSSAHARENVTYRRGVSTDTIAAGFQEVAGEVLTDDSQMSEVSQRSQDFTFSRSELTAAGFFPPLVDDEIVAPHGTFRVSNSLGLPVWRNSDEFGLAIRVHTVKVA